MHAFRVARRRALSTAVLAALASQATPSVAFEFKTPGGVEGNVTTTVSATSAWRIEDRQKDLIAGDNAARAGFAANAVAGELAGYTGSGGEANLNFDKGDRYSTQFKFLTELSMSKGDAGGLIRVKGWYDQALNDRNARFGNAPNGYRADRPLSDDTFPHLNRFEGIALLDAYAYATTEVGGNPLQVRLGRQAVNWGESIFVLGSNQLSPIDVTALNKAGTQIKEALLPVWSLTGNLGLPGGMSLEGFYQFKWEPFNLENCGTFFAGDGGRSDPGKCDIAHTPILDNKTAFGLNSYIAYVKHPEPKDSGQWGLAFRFPVDALDTEFGLYAMNFHSRIPVLSGQVGSDLTLALANIPQIQGAVFPQVLTQLLMLQGMPLATAAATAAAIAPGMIAGGDPSVVPGTKAGLLAGGVPMTTWRNGGAAFGWLSQQAAAGGNIPAAQLYGALGQAIPQLTAAGLLTETNAFLEYPEDIRLYAISAATTLAGWSIGAELSYSPNTPVQLAPGDFTYAVIEGKGPFATDGVAGGFGLTATGTRESGTLSPKSGYVKGWERTTKTQFQVNALNTLPALLGAKGGLLIGEVGFQWAGIDNSTGSNKRYGRAFTFDAAPHIAYDSGECPQQTTSPVVVPLSLYTGCRNEGYFTDFAWGYRIDATLNYPAVFGTSWQFSPGIYWSHDVKGYSIDTQFLEGRKTLALSAGFSLNNVHKVELTYTNYANSATFNTNRDKDNVSIVYNYTF